MLKASDAYEEGLEIDGNCPHQRGWKRYKSEVRLYQWEYLCLKNNQTYVTNLYMVEDEATIKNQGYLHCTS